MRNNPVPVVGAEVGIGNPVQDLQIQRGATPILRSTAAHSCVVLRHILKEWVAVNSRQSVNVIQECAAWVIGCIWHPRTYRGRKRRVAAIYGDLSEVTEYPRCPLEWFWLRLRAQHLADGCCVDDGHGLTWRRWRFDDDRSGKVAGAVTDIPLPGVRIAVRSFVIRRQLRRAADMQIHAIVEKPRIDEIRQGLRRKERRQHQAHDGERCATLKTAVQLAPPDAQRPRGGYAWKTIRKWQGNRVRIMWHLPPKTGAIETGSSVASLS